jgi:AAA15 family ATPase/GTPase
MIDTFVTKILICEVLHLSNLTIPISETERKHLILTGKNGSGKTSILKWIYGSIKWYEKNHNLPEINNGFNDTVSMCYNNDLSDFDNMIWMYIPAHRSLDISLPKSIEKVEIDYKFTIDMDASSQFLKYMLNLDYQRLSAESEGKKVEASQISKWFERFLETLRDVFDCPQLELKKDAKNLVFKIVMPGREPFGLNEMADGYSAFLKIVMELMMRMESKASAVYDLQGIVLIDEIETHLHV